MRNRKILEHEEITKMIWKMFTRIIIPVMFTMLVGAALIYHARYLDTQTPYIKNGVLDLSEWNREKEFEVT